MDRLLEVWLDVTGEDERGRLEEEELRRVSTIFFVEDERKRKKKKKKKGFYPLWVFSDSKKERPSGVFGEENKEARRKWMIAGRSVIKGSCRGAANIYLYSIQNIIFLFFIL